MKQWIPVACLALLGAVASPSHAQQADTAAALQPASTQLRLAANNLLARDYQSGQTITSTSTALAQSAFVNARTYAIVTVKLEWKL